jgi:hypothetical protein
MLVPGNPINKAMRAFELILQEDPAQINQIAQGVQKLPPDTNPRLLQKLQDLIDLAINGPASSPKPKTPSTFGSVSTPLSNVEDRDVKAHYKVMAKFMIGNGLTSKEIKDIIAGLQEDSIINMSALQSTSSDLSKIIPYYNTSPEVAHYFNDMLMYQPGQRIGPGEILFSTHSKNLTKGIKGDLSVISDNREIEVKGGKTAGRFSDDDVKTNVAAYSTAASKFIKKYSSLIKSAGKSGYSMEHIVAGMNANPDKAKEIVTDAISVIGALWGADNKYLSGIKKALTNKNASEAAYYHGLANLEIYFGAKAKGMGILFVHAGKTPAKTNYADSLEDLLNVSNISAKSAYPISLRHGEAFPKITAIAK